MTVSDWVYFAPASFDTSIYSRLFMNLFKTVTEVP